MATKSAAAHKKSTVEAAQKNFFHNPWVINLGLIAIYFLLAFAAYWPVYPGDPSKVVGGPGGDPAQSAWFLRWTVYAISHGHNPFFTNWINFPNGANLTQNTLMPLLGIITAPLTSLAGPIASFNLIAWAAFPLSATSMFYVCRKFGFSKLASFAAGLLFGFSPYMMGQGEGHIMLTFVPLLPLIALTSWQLIVKQDSNKNPYLLGVILAVELLAQYFIEPEVLVIAVLSVLLGVVLLAIFRSKYITRDRLNYAIRGIAVALVIFIVIMAYPVWYMSAGPQHFKGPNFGTGNPYRSDLVGLFIPTLNQRLTFPIFQNYSAHTAGSDLSEVGDYIGVVLLAIICVSLVKWRKNKWLAFCSVSALLIWIGSLGPRLTINTHRTAVILPFAVLTKIPLLQDMLPSRLSLAEWFFVSLCTAIIICEWQKINKKRRLNMLNIGLPLILALAVVITILPKWPYPTSAINEPGFFKLKSSAVSNQTVLAYPLPLYSNDQFMLWQAESNMQFKLIGAYIQNPSVHGTESQLPALLTPSSVEQWMAYEQGGSPSGTQWETVSSISTSDITSFLKNYKIGAVIVDPRTVNSALVTDNFNKALGAPKSEYGVFVWDNVQNRI